MNREEREMKKNREKRITTSVRDEGEHTGGAREAMPIWADGEENDSEYIYVYAGTNSSS